MYRKIYIVLVFFLTSCSNPGAVHSIKNQKVYYVYLAGKVRKGSEIQHSSDWRKFYTRSLARKDINFLTPEYSKEDNSNSLLVFGRDSTIIKNSDLVVVDASRKLGVGTAQEILISKYYNKPVLIVIPKNSAHRKTTLKMHNNQTIKDWINPFIVETVDFIVDDHLTAINNINNIETLIVKNNTKGIDIINKSVSAFELSKENVYETAILKKH